MCSSLCRYLLKKLKFCQSLLNILNSYFLHPAYIKILSLVLCFQTFVIIYRFVLIRESTELATVLHILTFSVLESGRGDKLYNRISRFFFSNRNFITNLISMCKHWFLIVFYTSSNYVEELGWQLTVNLDFHLAEPLPLPCLSPLHILKHGHMQTHRSCSS